VSEATGSTDADGAQHDEIPPDRFAVSVVVAPESFETLMEGFDLDVGDRPRIESNPDGTGMLFAFAPEPQIRELEAAGYRVEVGENVSEVGRHRQAEVGGGDRFEGGRVPPRGLGTKPGRGPENGGAMQ
jgi:hypothetical protein